MALTFPSFLKHPSAGYMNNDLVGLLASLIPIPQCHFLMAGAWEGARAGWGTRRSLPSSGSWGWGVGIAVRGGKTKLTPPPQCHGLWDIMPRLHPRDPGQRGKQGGGHRQEDHGAGCHAPATPGTDLDGGLGMNWREERRIAADLGTSAARFANTWLQRDIWAALDVEL